MYYPNKVKENQNRRSWFVRKLRVNYRHKMGEIHIIYVWLFKLYWYAYLILLLDCFIRISIYSSFHVLLLSWFIVFLHLVFLFMFVFLYILYSFVCIFSTYNKYAITPTLHKSTSFEYPVAVRTSGANDHQSIKKI